MAVQAEAEVLVLALRLPWVSVQEYSEVHGSTVKQAK